MTITITQDKEISFDGLNTRSFKTDEVHSLPEEHEKTLIDGGWAKTGGKEADAVENNGEERPLTPIEEANRTSQAPQAVDTAAVAARVVADGVTHDSEGSPVPGSTNEEGAHVTHAQDLVNSDAVKAGDEAAKAEEDAENQKATHPAKENKAAHPVKGNKAKKPAGKK